ncbi:MAG: tol-pal system protein YbgF [Candidatus Hydrogenedentes bacterium ADurb.Bin101]|jgi:tol-pal system protein YbgF|nr:MAG: tol-pal system protein YbgF [Candidatus Hydrogenedentes bacterium ADurb.Bin101]
MKQKYVWPLLGCIAVLLLSTGCETTGGSQTKTTIYDIHKRMVKLDKELGSSVTQLTESTATLNARIDANDEQSRTLLGMLEENRAKLDNLTRELESMKNTLYRHWNLTPGSAPRTQKDVSVSNVTIEGPAVPAPPAPSPTPLPTEPTPVPPTPTAPTPVPAAPVPVPAVEAPAPETPPAPPVPDQTKNVLEDSAPLPVGNVQPPPAAPATLPESTEVAAETAGAADPRLLYQQAQRSFANDDFSSALTQFDAFLSGNPDSDLSANAQFWKGKCQFNLSQYDDSVKSFESLRGKFPSSTKVPFAMHNQAVAHSRLGQTNEAIRLMEAVIEQYPASPAADQARADLRKLRGE